MNLRDAILATLATQTYTVQGQPMTGKEVLAYYRSIKAGEPDITLLGAVSESDRKVDRAHQILRKSKLIRYNGPTRKWVAT